jgi:hypothetical protein
MVFQLCTEESDMPLNFSGAMWFVWGVMLDSGIGERKWANDKEVPSEPRFASVSVGARARHGLVWLQYDHGRVIHGQSGRLPCA